MDEVENAFERLEHDAPAARIPARSDIEDELKWLAAFPTHEAPNAQIPPGPGPTVSNN